MHGRMRRAVERQRHLRGGAARGAGAPKDGPAAAKQFLKDVFRNVSILDKGAGVS